MKLRIEITSKDKASAMDVYKLARDSDPGIKPPTQRDREWLLTLNAEARVVSRILAVIDRELSRAFNAGQSSAETATGRLRWEVR